MSIISEQIILINSELPTSVITKLSYRKLFSGKKYRFYFQLFDNKYIFYFVFSRSNGRRIILILFR